MVGLGALVGLADIDDERAGEHHLRQSEGGAQQQALQEDDPELDELTVKTLDIIENGDAGCHANDGPDAHMIAAIALDKPGTEGTEEEESGGKDAHG